jgi:hypothetical protein
MTTEQGVPKNKRKAIAESAEKMTAFDLPRFKRWFGVVPFVNEQEEKDFDEFVLSFKSYLEPMDILIAERLFEYALEMYKIIQLMNMSAVSTTRQMLQFEHLDKAATEDEKELEYRDSDCSPQSLMRDFFIRPDIAWPIPIESAQSFSDEMFKKRIDVGTALSFEATLGRQVKISAAVNECMKRAKDLLRQIKVLSYDLAERLENEFWLEIIDKAGERR